MYKCNIFTVDEIRDIGLTRLGFFEQFLCTIVERLVYDVGFRDLWFAMCMGRVVINAYYTRNSSRRMDA